MRKVYLIYLLLSICAFLRIYYYCRPDLIECSTKIDYSYQYKKEDTNLFSKFRNLCLEKTYQHFPSPHSELLLGMTVGIDNLRYVPKFKEMLRDTGTIHVVVVSGYNISLVYSMVIKVLGSPYKIRNLSLGVAATLLYALMSGFEPPVVRAWLMGSIVSLGKFYGRKLNVLQVLFFTGIILIIYQPEYLYSLSFQLSFLATLSLVLFESYISSKIEKLLKRDFVLSEDLSATIAAQILIWPYLSYKFGQVSLISPLINGLILWTVPLATVWGGAFLIFSNISSYFGTLLGQLVFLPLDYFITLVNFFAKFEFSTVDFQLSLPFLLIYYLFILIIYYRKIHHAK